VVLLFTQEIKEILSGYGLEEELQQFENYLEGYKSRFIENMYPSSENNKNMLGQNSVHYVQLALCRSKSLLNGTATAINAKNGLLAMLAARAHLEVTGALAYFFKKLKNYYLNVISYKTLNEALQRLILGTKTEELSENAPVPVNVMTLIDAADDYISEVKKDNTRIFRDNYDYLSEYCHPDFFGITMQSSINKEGVIHYSFDMELKEKDLSFLNHILDSISLFLLLFDSIIEILRENGDLPEYLLPTK
jgi:hypothetical protein